MSNVFYWDKNNTNRYILVLQNNGSIILNFNKLLQTMETMWQPNTCFFRCLNDFLKSSFRSSARLRFYQEVCEPEQANLSEKNSSNILIWINCKYLLF